MYKMIFDYHTHTTFSHGKGTIEDNVKRAIERGLEGVAITDHGSGHLTYGVKRKNLQLMREEVERLKPLYPQISIYLGIEANIRSVGNNLDVYEAEKPIFDFILAGYHYGITKGYCIQNFLHSHNIIKFSKLMEKNTKMTIDAITKNSVKILTHPGDKGPFDIREIAKACSKNNVFMEISARHEHLTAEEIKIAAKEDVQFVINSDAHKVANVGAFEGGLEKARQAGLDFNRIVNIKEV